MPKCKDAIAVNRPTCIKDPEGTLAMLGTLGCGRGRTGCLVCNRGKGWRDFSPESESQKITTEKLSKFVDKCRWNRNEKNREAMNIPRGFF